MRSKPLIYLTELTHATTVYSNEYMPLATGYIACYAEMQLPETFDIQLFKLPEVFFGAMEREAPDILGVSHFCWNENLNHLIIDEYRKIRPDGIVVLGGAKIPIKSERQAHFLHDHAKTDIIIPHDGEFGFVEFLRRYRDCNGNRQNLLDSGKIDGCVYRENGCGPVTTGMEISRPTDLNEIPSPYLTGKLDPFFKDEQFTPLLQITRGCPFTCAYCCGGSKYNNCVRHFSVERVKDELYYIVERRKYSGNKRYVLCDSNYGMYAGDEEIGDVICELQGKYGIPNTFSAPCAKNNKDRVFRILSKIKNPDVIMSIQSTDATILRNINRQPINLEEHRDIINRFHAIDIPVQTEIITGLPGETIQTHLQTLRHCMELGIDEIHPFTLMFLEGSEIVDDESQQQFNWIKRYRIVPRDFGHYRGRTVVEIETVGVGSNTLSFEEWMYLRTLHGALRMIFNNAFFMEYTSYLKLSGINLFDFSLSFFEALSNDDGAIGQSFRSFAREAREELWETKEELQLFYEKPENFQLLLTGERGENLLAKYKVITAFEQFDGLNTFYCQRMLDQFSGIQSMNGIAEEINDLHKHIQAKASNIITQENMSGEPMFITLRYDVFSWKKDNCCKPLASYRLPQSMAARYVIRNENRITIEEIFNLHSNQNSARWKALSTRYYVPTFFRIGSFIG